MHDDPLDELVASIEKASFYLAMHGYDVMSTVQIREKIAASHYLLIQFARHPKYPKDSISLDVRFSPFRRCTPKWLLHQDPPSMGKILYPPHYSSIEEIVKAHMSLYEQAIA